MAVMATSAPCGVEQAVAVEVEAAPAEADGALDGRRGRGSVSRRRSTLRTRASSSRGSNGLGR